MCNDCPAACQYTSGLYTAQAISCYKYTISTIVTPCICQHTSLLFCPYLVTTREIMMKRQHPQAFNRKVHWHNYSIPQDHYQKCITHYIIVVLCISAVTNWTRCPEWWSWHILKLEGMQCSDKQNWQVWQLLTVTYSYHILCADSPSCASLPVLLAAPLFSQLQLELQAHLRLDKPDLYIVPGSHGERCGTTDCQQGYEERLPGIVRSKSRKASGASVWSWNSASSHVYTQLKI